MTTIAVNRTTMAADTRLSGEACLKNATKIWRIRDSIVGVAGDAADTTKFLAWFRKECPVEEAYAIATDDHDFGALVLNKDGLFYYQGCCEPDKLHDEHTAIGAGAQGAKMAMMLGKTPSEAVALMMEIDECTGGKIEELTLDGPHRPRRRRKAQKKRAEPEAQGAAA